MFAALLSALLLPLTSYLASKNINRVVAIFSSLIIAAMFIGSIIYFFSTQIARFVDDIPAIQQNLEDHFIQFQVWLKEKLHVSFSKQNEYINTATNKLKASGTGYITNTFYTITEILMLTILLPIYSFLILYYRDLIKRFLYAVFLREHKEKVTAVISGSKKMINRISACKYYC